MTGEWPLLIFSVLGQLGIGTFIVLNIVRILLNSRIGADAAKDVTRLGIFAVGPIMFLALFASLFHLGSPFLGIYAVLNFKTSWLSREIFFTGFFTMCWAITFILYLKQRKSQVWEWITSIVGIVAVISMAGVYAHTNIPAWTNVNTYLTFIGTACFMGAIATGIVVKIQIKKKGMEESAQSVLQQVNVLSFFALAVQLIFLPIYISTLVGAGEAASASVKMLSGSYAVIFVLKWALSIGVSALMYYGIVRDSKNKNLSSTMLCIVFGGAVLSELIGRYIFYAIAVPAIFGA